MEAGSFLEGTTPCPRGVGGDGHVFKSEGYAIEQSLVRSNSQFRSHDIRIIAQGSLRTGRNAERRQPKHQRLSVEPTVSDFTRQRPVGHEEKGSVRRVEKSEITQRGMIAC